MNITKKVRKIKIEKVWIDGEKEIEAKVGENKGKKFIVCPVAIKVADDSTEYAGKWIKSSFFPIVSKTDSSKNKTATQVAESFRQYNEGKIIMLNVIEEEYEKDGEKKIALKFKTLSKAEKELASQFLD